MKLNYDTNFGEYEYNASTGSAGQYDDTG